MVEPIAALDTLAVPFAVVAALTELRQLRRVVRDPLREAEVVGGLAGDDEARAGARVEGQVAGYRDWLSLAAKLIVLPFLMIGVDDEYLRIRAVDLLGDDAVARQPSDLRER